MKEKLVIAQEIFSEFNIKIGADSIRKWEAAETFPTKDKLSAIAKIYNIDFELLVKTFEISKEAHHEKEVLPGRSARAKPIKTSLKDGWGLAEGDSSNRGHRY
jgi:transcriptional regulator with XRE-family HTH domain